MRRILAALAALLMIAGGFGLWAARTGRFSNDKATSVSSDTAATAASNDVHLTIACIPETENACASISDPLVGFSVEAPTITETQIGSKGDSSPDGWITTALGYERVRLVNNSLAPAVDVGSTKVVVVTRSGGLSAAASCKADLGCLAIASKVSFPSVKASGAGLSISTLAATATIASANSIPLSIDDLPDADAILAGLRRATKATSSDPLTSLTSIRLLDAVVLPESRVREIAPVGVTSTATSATVSIVLVLSKAISAERARAITKSVTDALKNNGFDPPASTRQVPNSAIANDLFATLN